MTSLIERLEGAEVGSRELDADLQDALFCCQIKRERQLLQSYVFHMGDGEWELIPHYTTSLDAALALVERVLPGWAWSVGNKAQGGQAYLMRGLGDGLIEGKGASPALALCIALLKVLIEHLKKPIGVEA